MSWPKFSSDNSNIFANIGTSLSALGTGILSGFGFGEKSQNKASNQPNQLNPESSGRSNGSPNDNLVEDKESPSAIQSQQKLPTPAPESMEVSNSLSTGLGNKSSTGSTTSKTSSDGSQSNRIGSKRVDLVMSLVDGELARAGNDLRHGHPRLVANPETSKGRQPHSQATSDPQALARKAAEKAPRRGREAAQNAKSAASATGLNVSNSWYSNSSQSSSKQFSEGSKSSYSPSSTTSPNSSQKSSASTRSSSNHTSIRLSGGGDFKSYTSSSADIGGGSRLNFCFDEKGYFHMYKTDNFGNITDYPYKSPIIDLRTSSEVIENIKSALIEIQEKFPHPSLTESGVQIGKNSKINSRFSDFLQASNNFKNGNSNGADLTSLSFNHANYITTQQNDQDVANRMRERRATAKQYRRYNGPIESSISYSNVQDSQPQDSGSWYGGGHVPLTDSRAGAGASGSDEGIRRLYRTNTLLMEQQSHKQRMLIGSTVNHPNPNAIPFSATQLEQSMRHQYSRPKFDLQVNTGDVARRNQSLLEWSKSQGGARR